MTKRGGGQRRTSLANLSGSSCKREKRVVSFYGAYATWTSSAPATHAVNNASTIYQETVKAAVAGWPRQGLSGLVSFTR